MRVAQPVVLSEEVRRKLEQQSRGRSTAARVVLRSRIVLLASDGLQNKQIARKLQIAPRMVTLWRGRFLETGIEGLLKDAPRPGRTPSIGSAVTAALIAKTTQSTPANATQWSTRTMAKEMSLSKASVSRIWRANGLKPHRVESFKVSNDPNFADKLEAIVGLYLNPPEHALVLSVDEKSQIQALDRTAPILPLRPGLPERQTHDYKRHGTTTLFAAFNILNGKVIGTCQERHRSREFIRFLNHLEAQIPTDQEVHLIMDNYCTHKSAEVQRWLKPKKRRRFHFHFTPTSSSWLNQVERFFALITGRMIRRGTFRSSDELETAIYKWLATWNGEPTPFVWKASADVILDKVRRCKELSETGD